MLILDEPTSVLTPSETEGLFELMRQQRDGGDSVVFISHKLREVLAIADRITVMRQGKNVKTLDRAEADVDTITKLMIGGDVPAVRRKRAEAGETVIEVGGAHGAERPRGGRRPRPLTQTLARGRSSVSPG